MTDPAPILAHLIIEIQTKANEIVEASRSSIPEGGSSDPNLNLERLIQQVEADAEIAGYCTTEKSRQNRRDALVRSAASSLLALFVMDRDTSLRRFVDKFGQRFEETFRQEGSNDVWLRKIGSEELTKGVPWSPGEMTRAGMREDS